MVGKKTQVRKTYRKLSRSNRGSAVNRLEDDTADIIRSAIGEDALHVAKIIAKAKEVSEFKIVQMARLDIQRVRNLLYKLHSSNLADYKRIKDNRKGIYVSYWKFNKAMAKELFEKLQQEKLERFRERLEVETNNVNCFFICPSACVRVDFTKAVQQRFRCEECGQLMIQDDNTRTIDVLREKIREMEAVVA